MPLPYAFFIMWCVAMNAGPKVFGQYMRESCGD